MMAIGQAGTGMVLEVSVVELGMVTAMVEVASTVTRTERREWYDDDR